MDGEHVWNSGRHRGQKARRVKHLWAFYTQIVSSIPQDPAHRGGCTALRRADDAHLDVISALQRPEETPGVRAGSAAVGLEQRHVICNPKLHGGARQWVPCVTGRQLYQTLPCGQTSRSTSTSTKVLTSEGRPT